MSDAYAPAVGAGIGSTALGRLQMRVPDEGGFEDVVIERRWPDMAAARAWCERTLARAAAGTTVLEVQVFEESWKHAKSWETTRHRPVAEVLQLAVVTVDGTLRWAEPRSMTPRAGARSQGHAPCHQTNLAEEHFQAPFECFGHGPSR